MRRGFWGFLIAAIVLGPVAPARATVPVVIIEGRGFGHGVGMAQDGAFWMAKAGATTPQILGQFYPGTTLAKVSRANVRVAVFTGPAMTVAFPNGGRIDERGEGNATAGFPIRVDPGGQARVRLLGHRVVVDKLVSARATSVPSPTTTTAPRATSTTLAVNTGPSLFPTTTTTSPTPTTRAASAEGAAATAVAPLNTGRPLTLTPADGGTVTVVDRQRTYRGTTEVVPTDTGVRAINQVDVEAYLRGMGEVRDPSWPAAALRTQAVAARTYALRAMGAAGELCDDTRCQVYLGRQAEYSAMDKAVSATAGQVLAFNHGLASAVYSSNGGGHSASREEGFGTTGGNYPYLRAAPYETKNPMPWTVVVGLDDLAARLGKLPLTGARVDSQGPSGRALTVALETPDAVHTVTGRAFAAALGLRSTMFKVRMGVADVAPPPPTGGSVLQELPDDVAVVESQPATVAVPLAATALDLPDRPRIPATALGRRVHSTGVTDALGQLALALSLILAVSYGPTAIGATLRSLRGARPPAGGRR
jgi:SpoIID/LytB domain protein